jgi:hypothetical protein
MITPPTTRQRAPCEVRSAKDLPARNSNAHGIIARPQGINVMVAEPSFGGTPLINNQPQVIASRYPLTLAGRSPPKNKVGNKIMDVRATVSRITEKQKIIDHVIELTIGLPVNPIIRSRALPNSSRERGALFSTSSAGVPVSGGAC